MKNLFTILTVIIASIALSSSVSAQYSIPAYDVHIVTEPTTFEEGGDAPILISLNTTKTNFIQSPGMQIPDKVNTSFRFKVNSLSGVK